MDYNSWNANYSYFRSRISSHKEAIFDYDTKRGYTYGDLEKRSNLLSNYLVERLNLKKGDRIGFCTRNCVEHFDAYYATAKTGTILTTYNQLLSENELIEMINNEEPKVLFYEDIYKKKIERIKPSVNVEVYVVLSGAGSRLEDIHYEDIMDYGNEVSTACENLDLEDIHMIIHTGGTTGVPKGAMISHRALLFNSVSEVLTWDLNSSDSTYLVLPLFHTAAWNVFTLPILLTGGRVVINKCFSPQLALEIIGEERPTTMLGVSTMFRMMINTPEFEKADFKSLKWILSGAAPTPVDIMEKFWNRGVKFSAAYGMTEAGPNNLSFSPDHMTMDNIRNRYESVGRPMLFNQVKVVNENGDEVGFNEHGEIVWRGPLTFSGYWKNEKETAKTLRNGWVHTGDVAMIDQEGYYYIVGRKKNMFITGGENIFPPVIEKEIYKHPKVHEVCVIGVPDDKWGEVGKAVISLRADHSLNCDELKKFLKGKLGSIQIPKYVQIVEELPKNNAGKLQRGVVQQMYGQ